MADTSIEWTDKVWNPIRARRLSDGKTGHYCQKVSPGCANCYAERQNGWTGTHVPYAIDKADQVGLYLDEKALQEPLKWRKPSMVFVCSMTDLYADFVPSVWLDRIYAVMALCPQHTFQILTKRPERRAKYMEKPHEHGFTYRQGYIQNAAYKFKPDAHFAIKSWPLPNCWEGVSIVNQDEADRLIPLLLKTPAAVRWLSAEPLLGPIEFSDVTRRSDCVSVLGKPALAGIDWVVCGGESGPAARPMHPEWARSLRDQCVAAKVPFFFKQWGEWAPVGYSGGRKFDPAEAGKLVPATIVCSTARDESKTVYHAMPMKAEPNGFTRHRVMEHIGKKAAGCLLDEREWNEYPAVRA